MFAGQTVITVSKSIDIDRTLSRNNVFAGNGTEKSMNSWQLCT